MRRVPVILALASLALLSPAFDAEAKRRAVAPPAANAFALESLRPIVGDASIVALGDATHGMHELFALRLPMIEYLVREMGFDVVSIEGPFALFERIDVYAQGGPGDPRALLAEGSSRLRYFFWNVEEMLAVIEWVRAYNLTRGDRPAVRIAGADIYDYEGAAAAVLARHPDVDYACVVRGERDGECEATARAMRDTLVARGADADTIHYADVVLQAFHLQLYEPREQSMAANLLWIREHRGTKVVHWGHQEHAGKLPSPYARGRTMGTILAEQRGSDYVAIGTLAGSGSFLQWEKSGDLWIEIIRTLPDPAPGSYEARFRALGFPMTLVPLRGESGSASFRTAGTTSGWTTLTQPLGEKLDAVIYVDVITPTRPLWL